MTDEEIELGNKCCAGRSGKCDDCPYKDREDCSGDLSRDIAILITSLKAENSRLKEELDDNLKRAQKHDGEHRRCMEKLEDTFQMRGEQI